VEAVWHMPDQPPGFESLLLNLPRALFLEGGAPAMPGIRVDTGVAGAPPSTQPPLLL